MQSSSPVETQQAVRTGTLHKHSAADALKYWPEFCLSCKLQRASPRGLVCCWRECYGHVCLHVIQRIIERSTDIVCSTCMEERWTEIKGVFGCKPLFNPKSGYRMILQTTGGSSNCFSSQPQPLLNIFLLHIDCPPQQ